MNGPFVANSQTKIVHNLNGLKSECNVLEITPKVKQYFYPDQTIDEIQSMGFTGCKFCIK